MDGLRGKTRDFVLRANRYPSAAFRRQSLAEVLMGDGPQIHIEYLDGNCPVQAEGTIDGKNFYFRARYNAWSLNIGGEGDKIISDPEWSYKEKYGNDPYSAGWMSEDEARSFIDKAARIYLDVCGVMHGNSRSLICRSRCC